MATGDSQKLAPRGSRLVLGLILGLVALWPVSMQRSWGWDESMHAELPAARIALELGDLHFRAAAEVVLTCEQYPPGYPLLLAAVQLPAGVAERVARQTGRCAWALGLLGLFLLAEELARRVRAARGERPGDAWIPWIALGFALASPLALMYSGTLFMETPFLALSTFALRAWLRRTAPGLAPRARLRRELAAGCWIAAALFTKWNYGLLLGFGLALDLTAELGVRRWRGGGAGGVGGDRGDGGNRDDGGDRLGRWLARAGVLAAPTLLACAWWFVIPWPGDWARAASHRAAFASFLEGNTDPSMHTEWARRLLDWTTYFARTPRLLALELLGLALAAAFLWRVRAFWTLAVAGLAAGLPVWTHNMQLDRFLLADAGPLWVLAACGLGTALPRGRAARGACLILVPPAVLMFPLADGRWIAGVLGFRTQANADHVEEVLAARADLRPGRALETGGLARGEHDRLLDWIAAEVGSTATLGWTGMSSELSPAAVHLGLLARGGERARFLDQAHRRLYDSIELADPGYPPEQVLAWAAQFDVVLASTPVDLKDRPSRRFMEKYRQILVESGAWQSERLGELAIERPGGTPVSAQLFALRR